MKSWKYHWRSHDLNLARKLRRHLDDLTDAQKASTALKKLAKNIEELYFKLYGNSDVEPNVEDIQTIIPELIAGPFNIIHRLIFALNSLDFETKKRVAAVVSFVIRRSSKNHYYYYLEQNHEIISTLLHNFDNTHSAHRSILIEMCKRREIAQILLNDNELLLPQRSQSTTILQTTNPIQLNRVASDASSETMSEVENIITTSTTTTKTKTIPLDGNNKKSNEDNFSEKKTKKGRFGFFTKKHRQTSIKKEKSNYHRVGKNRLLKWVTCSSKQEWSSSQSTMDIPTNDFMQDKEDSLSYTDNLDQDYQPSHVALENLFQSTQYVGACSVLDWMNCHPDINSITTNNVIVGTTNSNIDRDECCTNQQVNAVNDPHSSTTKITDCTKSSNDFSPEMDRIASGDIIAEMFRHSDNAEFTISRDAYTIVEIFAMRHCDVLYRYVKINNVLFLKHISRLIQSTNYLTQRSYIKLWNALLLKPQFQSLLIQYTDDANNLKIVMKLLKHHSKIISIAAFRLFQIFVFNPNKQRQIHIFLWSNKNKLIQYFENFHPNSNGCGFEKDKKRVVEVLSELEKPVCDNSATI